MAFNIYETEVMGVHLCYMDVSGLDIFSDYPEISEYRHRRISKLKQDRDKKLSLGAELLLIHALKKHFQHIPIPVKVDTDSRGKPQIEGVQFSIAHAGNVALCAVSDTVVGVDIEHTDRENSGVWEKYFTNEEKKYNFSYIWTRKEAAVKADGGGIAIGLRNVDVSNDTVEINGKTYKLISIKPEITGYDIALALL